MVSKNNIVPRGTGKKHWRMRTKTMFDIPMKRLKRRMRRRRKAAAVFPRPVKNLRPVVRCCQLRHSMKLRQGRGFSVAELQAAGVTVPYARTIGISVDVRRRNRNEEEFQRNVKLLEDYLSRLVYLPRNPKKIVNPRRPGLAGADGVVVQEFLSNRDALVHRHPRPTQEFDPAFTEMTELTEEQVSRKTANRRYLSELRLAAKQSYGFKKAKRDALKKKKGKKGRK